MDECGFGGISAVFNRSSSPPYAGCVIPDMSFAHSGMTLYLIEPGFACLLVRDKYVWFPEPVDKIAVLNWRQDRAVSGGNRDEANCGQPGRNDLCNSGVTRFRLFR